MVIKLGDLEKIVGHTGHERADFLVVIKAERKLLVMGEKFISKIPFHTGADHVSHICDKVVTAEFYGQKSQHQEKQEKYRFLGSGKSTGENRSGDIADDQGDGKRSGSTQKRQRHIRQKSFHIRPVIREKFTPFCTHDDDPFPKKKGFPDVVLLQMI